MTGVRPMVKGSGVNAVEANPGDILLLGESLTAGGLATVGAGTLLGALLATGIVNRTGPTGAYTDTTDTAANIIAAIQGNMPAAEIAPGTSFRVRFINTVAFAMTLAAGTGVVLNSAGSTLNAAASTWRDYLFTVKQAGPSYTINSNTATSAAVTFVLPQGLSAFKIGPAPEAINIAPGMTVTGSGVPAGTTVLNVTYGQGGITGVTLSAATTTTVANTPLVFGPTVTVDSLGSGTL